MRVATVDGLLTLFYDGSERLRNQELDSEWWHAQHRRNDEDDDVETLDVSVECKRYWRERQSWQQIIVVDGVTEIPDRTFLRCFNIERVIFANTVTRIKEKAFMLCMNLVSIKWSMNLEYIGDGVFYGCNLSSVFIPPTCREIGGWAFEVNRKLTILNVPQDAVLGYNVFQSTELRKRSPFGGIVINLEELNIWLKNINNTDQFALHRVCSSFQPTLQMILDTMEANGGPKAFNSKNSIGITPSRYLKENPYANVTEKEVVEKYVVKMMGEL
ncbi:hypothetical protein CTEN210_06811 [Chaetoceros tenuissimus]|uniref:Uncharacterized protein n=1 Tax=Chaetoceros tenuissimus TaxID=426638 RepID=A0AAD3CSN1_9STRA|nr:hypothetical protein CTEN210_06811 [Chaetoceros tenuissimus]